jgi:nitroreductase
MSIPIMNETLQTLHARRSIRSYKPDRIETEKLEAIVAAGKAAASGMNRQPYHITVIQNPEALKELAELARNEALKGPMAERAKDPAFSPTYGAPAFIMVSAEEGLHTAQFDATLVMGNMFNAARSLGIGSCWLFTFGVMAGAAEARALYAKLGVPGGYKVAAGACFGYPAADWPEAREKRTDNVNYIL